MEGLVLVAGFPSKSRVTFALVWPDALSVFALWLAHSEHISSGFLGIRLYPVVDGDYLCSRCHSGGAGGWPFWGWW